MSWVVFDRWSGSSKRASAGARRGETTSSKELARELSQAGDSHPVRENAWRGGAPSRGVSIAINYVLVIGIAAIFTLGVLFFSGVFVEDQRERAIQDQLEVVGTQLGAEIEQIDRLVTTSGEAELEVQPELIEMVAGTTYTVEVDSQAGELVLRSRSPQVEVRTSVSSVSSDLTSETVRGDAVKLTYEEGVIRIERDE